MPEVSFSGLLVVVAAGFAAPFLLGLVPRVRLPAVVLEIVFGIVLGPSVLGWVRLDLPIEILSVVGLAFLLFLSGMEVDLDRLRGRLLRLSALGIAGTLALGFAVGTVLRSGGLVRAPSLIAVALVATSLGIVVAVLKDAGLAGTDLGQLVIASATLADVTGIVLLSLLFSRADGGAGATVALLVALGLLTVVIGATLARAGRVPRVSMEFMRLADTTAQLRVRAAVVLLLGFVALAGWLGLETILGAFLAGVLVAWLDRAGASTHPQFRAKLEGIGFGFVVPVFFVASGVQFDLAALTRGAGALLLVPALLLALLVCHAVPALLYRGVVGSRGVLGAGLLQATSLPFIVTATMIGRELDLLSASTASALVAAGLLSVLVFPLLALTVLRGAGRPTPAPGARASVDVGSTG